MRKILRCAKASSCAIDQPHDRPYYRFAGMPKAPRNTGRHPFDEAIVAAKRRKIAPHEVVLDALAAVEPTTRPMFGCLAVYVEDRIVLILRDRHDSPEDNGVWLATTAEHHETLRREF